MRAIIRSIFRILTAPFRFAIWIISSILKWIYNRVKAIYKFFTAEPDDAPLAETFAKATQSPKGFLTAILLHLVDLRNHLIRITLVLLIASVIAFDKTELLFDWLAQPTGGINELTSVDITETVRVALRVALLAGFFVSLPYIGLEMLIFVADGIRRRTRMMFLALIPIVTILFAGGMLFAYSVMLPVAVPFLLDMFDIPRINRLDTYISFIIAIMFWLGIAFQFPLVSFILSSLGILKPQTLLKQWRISVVIIAILAAVITPTPDIFNMMIVFVPLLFIYFLGVGTSFIARTRRGKRESDSQP
ncbi:MAG: twin-arginine translocase subunit TatC [Chloroflexota bacterium]